MGLDMYLEKITKVSEDELKGITGLHSDDILNKGYNVYSKEDMQREEDLIAPIKNYLTAINYMETYIDIAAIKADNDIPKDAWISGEHGGKDGIGYSFMTKDDKHFQVELTTEDAEKYVITKETEGFVCKSENLAYWRKNYDLHETFEQRCETIVENCGYAPVPDDLLLELIDNGEQITENDIECDEDSIIVYHPWW